MGLGKGAVREYGENIPGRRIGDVAVPWEDVEISGNLLQGRSKLKTDRENQIGIQSFHRPGLAEAESAMGMR